MKLKYLIIGLWLTVISQNALFAQSVIVKGRVVDSQYKLAIPSVTVSVGFDATSTDSNGYFSLSAKLGALTEKGINFTCIGYLPVRLIYEPAHIYMVDLVRSNTQLNEVIIGAGSDIIRKAVLRISQNYPKKPIVVKGILRIQTWRNQSEYFKSDALIEAYIPPYDKSEKASVSVLQNKIDSIYDRSLRHLRYLSNYNVLQFEDIAHNRLLLNTILKKRKFDYWLIGKQVFNKRTVYVVNTNLTDTSKRFNKINATFYIDTATFAFVAANLSLNNAIKPGLLTAKALDYRISYELIGGKWYIREVHATGSWEYKSQLPQSTVDFIRTAIDSLDGRRIPYKDIVQNTDDILLIDKPGEKTRWSENDSVFRKAESDSKLAIIPNTLLDIIKKNNAIANPPDYKVQKPFRNRVVDYLANDNVRTFLGLTKFPVTVNSKLYNITGAVDYGWGGGVNYRLYQNLFFELQEYANFYSNKHIGLSLTDLNLANEFIFRKNSRSITLTPFAGFEQINANYKKSKIVYDNFNCGLRISFQETHKMAYFISSNYDPGLTNKLLNGAIIHPNYFAEFAGIVFKY